MSLSVIANNELESFKEVPKWLYQREKLPRQDVTKDVQQFGSLMHLHSADAIIVVN
jgi:hypothetical protein